MWESEIEASAYLSGVIDGEGWVGTNPHVRGIRVGNTDPAIITAIESACDYLGINYRKYKKKEVAGCKPFWELAITRRDNIEHAASVLRLRSEKREKLDYVLASYQPRRVRPSSIILWHLYWNKGMSSPAIAKKYGTCSQTIRNMMIQYKIPRRTQSEWKALAKREDQDLGAAATPEPGDQQAP